MLGAAYKLGSAKDGWVIYGLYTTDNPAIRYVGLTTKALDRRIYLHKWNAGRSKLPSHKWIAHHEGNIAARVLENCPVDNPEYLGYAERYWIASLKEHGNVLLNCNDGGWGGVNMIFTDEWRAEQSVRMTGEGNPMFGKKFSDEHRANISKGLVGKPSWAKGKTFTAEHRENISKKHADVSGKNNPMYGRPSPNTGKKHKDSTKALLSAARLGKSEGPHTRWHVNRNIPKPDTCIYCRERLNNID